MHCETDDDVIFLQKTQHDRKSSKILAFKNKIAHGSVKLIHTKRSSVIMCSFVYISSSRCFCIASHSPDSFDHVMTKVMKELDGDSLHGRPYEVHLQVVQEVRDLRTLYGTLPISPVLTPSNCPAVS